MANIFIAIEPIDGHVFPTLPLLKRLSERHEVLCMTGRAYESRIQDAGALFTPMPLKYDPNGKKLYDFHPELKELSGIKQIKFYINNRFLEMALPMIEEIENLNKSFIPDVYIGCPVTYAPLYLAEKLNKPGVIYHILPLAMQSKDHAPFGTGIIPKSSIVSKVKYKILNYVVSNLLFKDSKVKANKIREALSLKPYKNLFYDHYASPDKVLVTSIPELDYYRSDLPKSVSFIGPILPKKNDNYSLPSWWPDLQKGKKVILVNQGTLSTDINDLILPAIEAFKNEDFIVVAVPVKEKIKDLSPNVRTSEFIPFTELLPFVDVMITNGGFGATQMALAHGIPLVLAGNTVDDKMEVSSRVVHSGCGIDLKKKRPTPSELKAAVMKIQSNPVYRENALKMKKGIESYDPINLASKYIEDLITEYGED